MRWMLLVLYKDVTAHVAAVMHGGKVLVAQSTSCRQPETMLLMMCMAASHGPCIANLKCISTTSTGVHVLQIPDMRHAYCYHPYPSSSVCGFRLLALLVSLSLLACFVMHLCKLSCDCDCLQDSSQQFDTKREYVHQSELYGLEGRPLDPLARNPLLTIPDGDASSSGRGESGGVHYGPQWGLLTLSQPITASEVSCCTAAHQMLCLPRCAIYISLRHRFILSHKLGVILLAYSIRWVHHVKWLMISSGQNGE